MAKILVTDGNYPCTLGIVRSLNKQGHKVDCIGEKLCLCRFSKYLNKVSYLKREFNETQISKFINFLKLNEYDYLIAVGAHSVNLISNNRNLIKKYVKFNIPSKKILDLCFSKKDVYAYASKVGVSSPRNYSNVDIKLFLDNLIQLPNSLVVKSNNELFEKKVEYVKNPKNYFSKNYVSPFKVIQERIIGHSYGFFGIYINGVLKSYFMHKRIREEPLTGGSSTFAKSIYDQEIYDNSIKLLRDLSWNGVVMIEYKRCKKNGKLYLIEINPKFWGSHDLAISAGRNFASMLLNLNDDKLFKNMKEYKAEVYYQWPITDLRTCLKNSLLIKNFFSDYFNKKVLNNFEIIDPLPTMQMICWGILKPILKVIKNSFVFKFFYRAKFSGIYFAFVRTINELTGIPSLGHSIISDKLGIGMQPSLIGLFILKIYGFKNILNLRSEFNYKKCPSKFINSYHFPIVEFDSPSVEQLIVICEFIENIIDNKKEKLYIHCREGISRAPTVAVAFLIYRYGLSRDKAIEKVLNIRPFIRILDNQLLTLTEFEKSYFINV